MTYEEKLNITVEAINEARQFTSKEYFTKLRLGTGNGLSRIDLGQLHDILLQLEQDEKIIKIEDTPTALKSLTNKTSDIMNAGGNKNYFLIDVLLWTSMRKNEKSIAINKTKYQQKYQDSKQSTRTTI
ncbi:hypothetical protein [Candidatus Chazhemtobacterium aquaticus]|uniref:Uncharacterized protein n=1 Tax=Candidatus Chazhemtobacterium aquaticus TaxID=2715735 RepID=A0A857N5A6_9BACT|nr:hypothetical protein [Candidatus Chazhemtobacterium aquaticus]QHO63164.1 hypothetical protein MICH65_0183 [Candidatus Chazhemtobacterium aquaticus]